MHEQAGALGRRQITVLLNQILQQKGNACECLVLPRCDFARLAVGMIKPLSDDGVEGGVQRFNAGDCSFTNFGCTDLAAPYKIGEAECVTLIIVLGLHRTSISNRGTKCWILTPW